MKVNKSQTRTVAALRVFAVLFAALAIFAGVPAEAKTTETVSVKVVLKVPRPDVFKRDLMTYAEKQGGYLLRLSPTELVLSLPASLGTKKILERVTQDALVVERAVSRSDVGERIVDLETGIKVKQKHLENLYKLFARTNFEQTLELEKETGRVVASIERMQGELRYLKDRLNSMVVRVGFQYRPPRRAVAPVRFAWLKRMNIQAFLRRFAGN